MGLRILGQLAAGVWWGFFLEKLEMGWTLLLCPVGEAQGGVGHGIRYVWVWEERRNWLSWFESQQKGEFRAGGQGEHLQSWVCGLKKGWL